MHLLPLVKPYFLLWWHEMHQLHRSDHLRPEHLQLCQQATHADQPNKRIKPYPRRPFSQRMEDYLLQHPNCRPWGFWLPSLQTFLRWNHLHFLQSRNTLFQPTIPPLPKLPNRYSIRLQCQGMPQHFRKHRHPIPKRTQDGSWYLRMISIFNH